jgi:Tfp pilus assembly protein PilF
MREAQLELEAAVKLDSRSSKNHYALAQVFRKLGRKADAAHEVAQFQTLKTKEGRTFVGISAAQGSEPAPAAEQRHPVTK